jgi:hypothetical protein
MLILEYKGSSTNNIQRIDNNNTTIPKFTVLTTLLNKNGAIDIVRTTPTKWKGCKFVA